MLYGRYGFPSFYSISISTVGVDAARVCLCRFSLDAAFLLTVGSFLITMELFYLQLTIVAFLLTILAFLLTVLASLLTVGDYSGKVRLRKALRDCKQRSLTVSKKAPTVSKKTSPIVFSCSLGGGGGRYFSVPSQWYSEKPSCATKSPVTVHNKVGLQLFCTQLEASSVQLSFFAYIQCHADGGATKGGGGKQMRANANKRRQTLTNASNRRGGKARQTWTIANKRLHPPPHRGFSRPLLQSPYAFVFGSAFCYSSFFSYDRALFSLQLEQFCLQ